METNSLVAIANHSRQKLEYLIRMAEEFEKHPNRNLLRGKVVATLFLSRRRAPVFLLRPQLAVWERALLALPIPR